MFDYTIESGDFGYGVYITGHRLGTNARVIVPEQIEGVDVVSISLDDKEMVALDVSGVKGFERLIALTTAAS